MNNLIGPGCLSDLDEKDIPTCWLRGLRLGGSGAGEFESSGYTGYESSYGSQNEGSNRDGSETSTCNGETEYMDILGPDGGLDPIARPNKASKAWKPQTAPFVDLEGRRATRNAQCKTLNYEMRKSYCNLLMGLLVKLRSPMDSIKAMDTTEDGQRAAEVPEYSAACIELIRIRASELGVSSDIDPKLLELIQNWYTPSLKNPPQYIVKWCSQFHMALLQSNTIGQLKADDKTKLLLMKIGNNNQDNSYLYGSGNNNQINSYPYGSPVVQEVQEF